MHYKILFIKYQDINYGNIWEGGKDKMDRISTKEAARVLNMDVVTLQYLLREEKIPIGFAFKKSGKKRYHYIIYRSLLEKFIKGME